MEVEEAVPEAGILFPSKNHSHNTDDGADAARSLEKEDVDGGKTSEGKENGGGILDHFISNFISHAPSSPEAGEDETIEVKAQDLSSDISKTFASGEEEGSGGLVAKISNFFHSSEGEAKENEEHKGEETVNDTGEGIIGNIVSHLPSSLPDNAATTPDEAAILIHSIIHD